MYRPWTIPCLFLLLSFVLLRLCPIPAQATEATTAAAADALSLSAECAILMDAESGRVLYAKNAEQRSLIASTTKILTALVVLERAEDLDATVTITPEWAEVEGSSMYLEAGDVVSIRGLLYGLLLNSGNDAATALACTVGGDEETFVAWMNELAAEIGMENSHFANPHGLDAEDHYSTAYDMAKLMIRAMENEDFREITATRYISIDGLENYYHNKLLRMYEYCISGKTGYTVAAGRTLVTASEKDGQLLVAVTLNAPDDWNDHIALYEYGFQTYAETTLCEQGVCVSTVSVAGCAQAVPVYCASDITWPLSDTDEARRRISLLDVVTFSVTKGGAGGFVHFLVNGEEAGVSCLVTGAYADQTAGEVSYEWKNDYKSSCRLAGLYPDAQPNGTYRMEGLLSTAFWHTWG